MIRGIRARRGAAMFIATLALAAPSHAVADGTDAFAPPAPVADGQCGTAVAAGDVNGDGRADVVLGCPGDDPGNVNRAGSALVFVRNAANAGFEAPVTLTHPSPSQLDACGVSVAVADVNDDARADVIVGCDGDDTSRGSMVVFRRDGANTGFATGQVVADGAQAADDNCGRRIAAGDLTGDGRADLVMGCPFTDAPSKLTTGAARVFVGDGTNFAASALTRPGPQDFDRCGEDVAVGDVDADGRGDVVMLCSGTSKVAMVFASKSGGGFLAGVDVAPGAGGNTCYRVAAGDVTGDARADLAIGCSQTTAPNGQFSGAVAFFARNAGNTGFDGPAWLYPPTPVNGAACAQGLAIADAAGTPARDVLMGCSSETTNTGRALVFPSLGAAGFAAARPFVSPTAATGQRCGFSVAAGDVDQNGGGDLLLGCYGQNTGATSSGGATVFYGTPEDPGTPPEPVVPPGPAPVAPPAPAPAPAAAATDASPTSVSASVPTVPAIPINADGSYTSPVVACDERTGKCTILMDPRVRPSAPRAAKAKPKTISLGAVRFTVESGRRGSGRGKLNKAGRALLAKRRSLPVTFDVRITDSGGNVRRLTVKTTLKRAKAKRR